MKISTEMIKFINHHYGSAGDPAPAGVDELVKKIGAQLGAVEEVINFGDRFDGVVIVKVVSCEDHPNADRLHVCKVDDGGTVQDVTRDENGLVQVVCGAPNVHADMLAAWLPPKSTVPSTWGTADPFVLEAREFRGVMSNGMMASPKELSLGDSHDGILEITEDFGPIKPGTMFADAYHLRGDMVINMENKMFTHRPDCFGVLGIAREIEGISQRPYKSPEWYRQNPEFPDLETDEKKLEVRNEIPDLVPRFSAIVLDNVKVGSSPVWVQADLARAGLRPINNIVDYTNFFMLETGQPLHAYDYDKVRARSEGDHATIVVRHPHEGEKIALLNGKTIEPRAEAMMIATDKELIGIGGVMGGADTEVDEHTKTIILEAANFDMYSIRRTSMAHGLFTDAVTRFNKGQSPLQTLAVLAKITDEIRRFAGGKVAWPLIDDNHVPQEAQDRGNIHAPVTVTATFINDRLGWQLSVDNMATLLTNVECKVDVDGQSLTITAPFWRTDIEAPEDIVEEIGRLNGFDKLPLDLPQRDLTPAAKNPQLELYGKLRQTLSAAGANELLTYSFVHGNLIDKVGQDRAQAFQLSNAISPDLQYFRLSLTPNLLEKVHPNIKAGHDTFALFEIGKAHNKTQKDDENLPKEASALAMVVAVSDRSADETAGAPYYLARKYLTTVLDRCGVSDQLRFESLDGADLHGNPWIKQMTAPFQANRSAVLRDEKGLVWGVVGEYRPSVRKAFKLPNVVAGFEIDPLLFLQAPATSPYKELSKFPAVEQDLCLKVPVETTYEQVRELVWVQSHRSIEHREIGRAHLAVEPIDIYQRSEDQAHKQITHRIRLTSFDRTLTDAEVTNVLHDITHAAADELKAERV